VVRAIRRTYPNLCLLAVSTHSSEELVLAVFRAGATDYLPHPGSGEELARQMVRHLADTPIRDGAERMVGDCEEMRDIRRYIDKVASTDSNVLITGETGTGKELVAGLVHRNSSRAGRPLVCINCAALPDTLVESELFGYERGAFTGAHLSTPGKIEEANGGTAFFDEIGELSPYAQARLLRVIEEKQIQRLGGRKPIKLDVRVVAATNRDLDTLAMEDKFRKDLYFRLNVGRIHLPPLRQRKRDIPTLVDHYVTELNQHFGATVEGVDPEVMEHLLGYTWPGNIRELRNLLEGVFVSRPCSKIRFVDLPEWFRKSHPLNPVIDVSEPDRLLSALHATNWNKSRAADRLNWSRMTLYRKMAKYGLQRSTAHTSL
jgi:DNA-binding NtrC family response regulator